MNKTEQKSIKIDTYKSIWIHDLETGNYERIQKELYPLEFLGNSFAKIPKLRALTPFLSKKPQGVDFYKYYTHIIENELRGKWENELEPIQTRLNSLDISLKAKDILDISGEPGFFAHDLQQVAHRVVVTAFAAEVAKAMKDKFSLESYKYDFQTDCLADIFQQQTFDFIFVRYAIGFCTNLPSFLKDCIKILNPNGMIYISYSPASRAVCARWMFDDYTYLRQYTTEYILETAATLGLNHFGDWNEGSYDWDMNLHFISKFFAGFYTSKIFKNMPSREYQQHNHAVLLQKK